MAKPVEKPHSVRSLGAVDTGPLKSLVARLSEATWDREDRDKENDFFCFHSTRHIIFRFIRANREAEAFYDTPAWPLWRPVLEPVMRAAIRPYGFAEPEFPKAMLARLAAGQVIDRHVDGAGSNLTTHKIHVPLVTNDEALFETNGEVVHLSEGHAYEVNNVAPHAARNGGAEDRIHLIFEVFDRAA